MKVPVGWLKEHLETDASAVDIAEALTRLGLEVEAIEDQGAALAPFIVAHVVEAKQHPNADRLRLCMVDTGSETLQVVCGAPNARTGMKGVFAAAGVTIPGSGMVLKKGKIRGEESNGMLCSGKELGISDDHEGIIELPDDAPVGESFAQVGGFGEAVIDVALTPNRADCTGIRGIARDLAAAGIGTLKPLNTDPVKGTFEPPINWRRDFTKDSENACPIVAGRYFRGVKNGDSPQWLQDRLKSIGLRPISALVDITNYLTFDLARPLHVFDADTVAGDLTMRLARDGETIGALDGETYTLDSEMVVIADDDGVQGIGGVMGGAGSGCGPDTVNVFLEVAVFDPVRIAAAGRKLGIESDARYRFERGIDPTSVEWATEVATRLILDLCGGEASTLSVAGEMPKWQRSQSLNLARVAGLGGVHLPPGEAARILDALGFETKGDDETLTAAVPPWRADIDGEADLVEEVLRVHGYDNIPPVPVTRATPVSRPALDKAQRRAREVRRTLAARGMVEAVTYSFIPPAQAALFGGGDESLTLANPISTDLAAMRPSALPNLFDAARRNIDRGIEDPSLFEVGPAYQTDKPDGELLVAAGVRCGQAQGRHWAGGARPFDAFDVKADALAALAAAGAPVDNLQITTDVPDWFHPGRSGVLRLGKAVLAHFGELHPATAAALDLKGPAAAFEVFLNRVPAPRTRASAARPPLALSPYQPVERDFAFLVDQGVAAGDIIRAARGAERDLITGVTLFDLYQGQGVPEGQKSVAIAVRLQPVEATFTDAEIEAIAGKIVAAVTKATGGTLRS